MMISLENHKSTSVYLSAFSEIVRQGKSNKTDLVFFMIARDHIINYLKHLKGTTSSLLLIQSKNFNISQCLSMIKNIVKIYYTEEIEIFFIEHFFKYINNEGGQGGVTRNVKIHKFIGILLEIFKGLRNSGLRFKNLLNDFEEREKSRSRSIEMLKKESMGELQTLYSAEKPRVLNEEDDLVFEVSDSKMENRSQVLLDCEQSEESIISIDLTGIYMSRKQSLKDKKGGSLVNSKRSSSKKVSRFGKSNRVSSRNSPNRKLRVNSSEVSSRRSDIFENLPRFSQREMQEYISKNFDNEQVQCFKLNEEEMFKKFNRQSSDKMKPRYSSRDCFNSESSYSQEMVNQSGQLTKSPVDAVDPIDISVSDQNMDQETTQSEIYESRQDASGKKRKAGRRNGNDSFIQIEGNQMRGSKSNSNSEGVNLFKTDNSTDVAASIFRTSHRKRNHEKSLSVVTEHFNDYDTSKFGSCSNNGAKANFSDSSITMVTEKNEAPSVKNEGKILVDKVYKSRTNLLLKNFKEARKNSSFQEKEIFSKKSTVGMLSKDTYDAYESERSLVPGTRAIRESLRNKMDMVLDDIIIEENIKSSSNDRKRERANIESSTVKTKKNGSKPDSFNPRNKPTTFNPYDKEKNFIAQNNSRRGEHLTRGRSKPKIEIINFEKTDKKSLVPPINFTNDASYPSILKTDNEDNLFSIFDQLTLKSTRREFNLKEVETPLKPTNLDKEKTIQNILKERRNSKNDRPRFIDVEGFQEFYYESQCKEMPNRGDLNLQKSKSSGPFIESIKSSKKPVGLGDSLDERFSMSKVSSVGSKFCEEIMIQNLRRLSSGGKENFGFNMF